MSGYAIEGLLTCTNYVLRSSTMLTNVECTNCGRPTKQGLKCSFCHRSVAKAAKPVKGAEYFVEPKEPKKQPKPANKKTEAKGKDGERKSQKAEKAK